MRCDYRRNVSVHLGLSVLKGVVISDMHCGHKLGCNDISEVRGSMLSYSKPFWENVVRIADAIGRVDVLCVNGDAGDGPGKKETNAHLTTDRNEQLVLADRVVSLFKADKRFFTRGSPYHADNGGNFEQDLAEHFSTDAHPDVRFEAYGCKVHMKHTIGRSDTWTGAGSQAQREIVSDVLQGDFEDYDAADVLIRSHVHYCTGAWLFDNRTGRKRECITTPALQMRAPADVPYVRKLRTWLYHCGVLYFEISKDGTFDSQVVPIPIAQYAPKAREYVCLAKK